MGVTDMTTMVIFECRVEDCEHSHHIMRQLTTDDIKALHADGWVFPDGPLPDEDAIIGHVSGLCPTHAINDARG